MFTIFQAFVLGIIQGITEWLPVSSSAFLTLSLSNIFNITDISYLIHVTLFLHLGTFFAALIYFRKDVKIIFKTLFNYKNSSSENKKIFNFLLLSTIITGIIGIIILKILTSLSSNLLPGKTISLMVGIFLLITGIIQFSPKRIMQKKKVI